MFSKMTTTFVMVQSLVAYFFFIICMCSIHRQPHFIGATVAVKEVVINGLLSDSKHVSEFLEPCRKHQSSKLEPQTLIPYSHIINTTHIQQHIKNRKLINFSRFPEEFEETTKIYNLRKSKSLQARHEVKPLAPPHNADHAERRRKIGRNHSMRLEVDMTPLLHDIEAVSDFDSYVQAQINAPYPSFSSIHAANTTSSKYHTPSVLFDRETNKTRLTWCELEKDNRNNIRLWESMRNRRILFVGDSLIRFQYLDLVYFLIHKRWKVMMDILILPMYIYYMTIRII